MMPNKLMVVSVITLLGTLASAQKPIGVWKGVAEMTMPMPKTEAERKMMAKIQEQTRKMVFHLTFKMANKYTMSVENGITADGGAKATNDGGTWIQHGRFITLQSSKKMTPPISGTISLNGKALTLVLYGNNGAGGRLSFVRT